MPITEITRGSIIDMLLLRPLPVHGRMDLVAFLRRVWNLGEMPSTDGRFRDAGGDIWQHMVNNDDWTYEYLLNDRLALSTCDDGTFIKFLEMCLHPLVLDDAEQRNLAGELNARLVHDGYQAVIEQVTSGRSIYRIMAADTGEMTRTDPDVFEVVLSFAGEQREYVEQVAAGLRAHGVSCFYDRYEEATLWGKDLAEHLEKVYRSARYCVMFISAAYADKVWTTHERRSALSRAVEEKGEYILPARFDDTAVPGVRHTLGYVDLRRKRPDELTALIIQKLGRDV